MPSSVSPTVLGCLVLSVLCIATTGKTTLLRRIARGSVPGWPLHLRVHLVDQRGLPDEVLDRTPVQVRWRRRHGH